MTKILFTSLLFSLTVVISFASQISASSIFIPMDLTQSDHLRAYGVIYRSLQNGIKVEWLLNYRGGSLLSSENQATAELCKISGVSFNIISDNQAAKIYRQIESQNMERIELEKAPKLAVYVPLTHDPWDDAVRLALDYAQVPYTILGGTTPRISSISWAIPRPICDCTATRLDVVLY